jgi:uncharacterized protein YndB with AHSA1/START domain
MEQKAGHFNAEGFLNMDKTIVAKVSLTIDASPSQVWDALVKPQLIQQSGAETISDWQVGSLITYKGTGADTGYEGKVLQAEPGRFLVCTWLNSENELPANNKTENNKTENNEIENNKIIRYDLSAQGAGTRLTITFIEVHDTHDEMKKLIKSPYPMHF